MSDPIAYIPAIGLPTLTEEKSWCVANATKFDESDIPLYTHPAELTDEEILEELLIPKSEWNSYKAYHCLKQIRAILRKAQET